MNPEIIEQRKKLGKAAEKLSQDIFGVFQAVGDAKRLAEEIGEYSALNSLCDTLTYLACAKSAVNQIVLSKLWEGKSFEK